MDLGKRPNASGSLQVLYAAVVKLKPLCLQRNDSRLDGWYHFNYYLKLFTVPEHFVPHVFRSSYAKMPRRITMRCSRENGEKVEYPTLSDLSCSSSQSRASFLTLSVFWGCLSAV